MCEQCCETQFKKKITEIRTCGSHEQCTRPTQKMSDAKNFHFQCNPNVGVVAKKIPTNKL